METFAAKEIIGGGDNLLATDVAGCFSNHAYSRPSLHIVHDSCVSRPMKLSKSSINKGYHILNEYSIELLPNFYRVLFGVLLQKIWKEGDGCEAFFLASFTLPLETGLLLSTTSLRNSWAAGVRPR
jgi:hypothetical protein